MQTTGISYATSADLVDINKGESYSSYDYYNMAKALVEKYPDILQLEIIGQSIDKKPIYSIIMTENAKESLNRDDFNVDKLHFQIEAGNHARETVNAAIVMKLIEDYAKDYYNDSHIKEFNLKSELSTIALHCIPLVNPDGHDLAKFGRNSVNTPEALKVLDSVKDTNYSRFKANLNGVDLNRNFPDEYFDKNTNTWINKFQVHVNQFHSYTPSGEHYGGPYGGSEPETQAIMKYVTKYDFRNFLSFHSRGNVIYSAKFWFSKEYNDRELALAKVASKINGYTIIHESTGKGSGFLSDYTAAQTLKPSITIETTTAEMPTKQAYFQDAYNKNYLVPLYIAQEGKKSGYFKYRLYVDNKYVRDFYDKDYAYAHAKRLGGIIVEGDGVPVNKLVNPITRADFIEHIIIENYDVTNLNINTEDTFIDDTSLFTTFAKNIGVLSHGDGYFRPNDNITTIEAATMIYRLDTLLGRVTDYNYLTLNLDKQYPKWAINPIKYAIYTNKLHKDAFKTELLSRDLIIK